MNQPQWLINKLHELDQFRSRVEVDEQVKQLVVKHPEVLRSGIPQEVSDRFVRGGVTLVEAYRVVTGRGHGTGTGHAGSITPEERQFAKQYDMTEDEYIKYRQRADEEDDTTWGEA